MLDCDWLTEVFFWCPNPVLLRKDGFRGRPVVGMLEVKELEWVSEGDCECEGVPGACASVAMAARY